MAEESDLERTEPATARRLEQAREEGQVPHSRELGTFLVLITAAGVFWMAGGWVMQRLLMMFRRGLSVDPAILREPQLMTGRFVDLSFDALVGVAPLMFALVVAALAAPLFLNAWAFAPKALQPNFSRLDPLQGLKRIVSWQGLAELGKAILKSVLVGGVAAWVVWHERDDLFGLLGQPLDLGLANAGHIISFSFLLIVGAMALIVAVDVPFQLWQFHDKLKMTRDEVRQEAKELEGDPQVKGRIRSLQREAARRRMMAAVPKADVIVTNPTHFAVALTYKQGMTAPKVVAKGRGDVALKIREIGRENNVPLLEAPPLARALYRHVDIDSEIPAPLYTAVAEVLAYVYQLDQWRKVGGAYPLPPRDLPVPPELVPESLNG